jgi:acyl-CoA synthetase (AMP-forming)/AMP-acid ligase II
VADCGVVGIPHPDWGEAVVAVIEVRPGAEVDLQELREFLRTQLGGIKTPKQIVVWPELPRSPVGKVMRKAIGAQLQRGGQS